jgi:hypothetical protein
MFNLYQKNKKQMSLQFMEFIIALIRFLIPDPLFKKKIVFKN